MTNNEAVVQRREYGLRYFVLLAFATLVVFGFASLPIIIGGGGLVWTVDGIPQHLNGLIAVGLIIRQCFRTLIAGQGIVIQEYLFNLGFGADITALVPISDPLNWLSALVPVAYTEYLYYALIATRLVLCAVFFSLYCRYKGNKAHAAFVGSLCYAFMGFALFWGALRHPFMLNAAYVFPLVLLGLEKVFAGERPTLFVLAVAFAFVLSPYFTYMICIFTVLYYVGKYLVSVQRKSVLGFLKLGLRFLGYGVLGLLISAVASFPIIITIASLDRVGVETYVPLHYQFTFYLALFSDLIGGVTDYNGAHRYLGPVAVVLIIVFACSRKHFEASVWKAWLAGFILLLAFSLIPFVGHVMNGMSYVSDRWLFAMDFCVAYIVCMTVPILTQLKRDEWKRIAICIAIVLVLAAVPLLYKQSLSMMVALGLLLAFACLAAYASHRFNQRVCSMMAAVGIMVSAGFIGVAVCAPAPLGFDYGSSFIHPMGSAHQHYTSKNPYVAFNELPASERASYRYSIPNTAAGNRLNESLNQKRNGLTAYASYYNQSLDNYRDELGIADYAFANNYAGSNSRLALDAFAAAKYFFAKDGEEWRIPYSYDKTELEANGYTLYQTDNALPLGFLYTECIAHSDYDSLSMVQKQEALLQDCVLDDDEVDESIRVDADQVNLSSVTPEIEVVAGKGVSIEEGSIVVKKANSTVTLSFQGLPRCENYVCLENLNFTPAKKRQLAEDATIRQRVLSLNEPRPESFTLTFTSDLGTRELTPSTYYNFKYCGKVDWAFNGGYSEEPIDSFEISFKEPGVYTFDSMSVVLQPVDPIVDELQALQSRGLSDISRGTNTITATATLDEPLAYAFFSQAYSTGWSATVDGEAQEVLKADTGFIALRIENPGEHEIVLKYETPGLRVGLLVSLLGVVVLFVVVRLWKRKNAKVVMQA